MAERKAGGKKKLLDYFLANIGKLVLSTKISNITGHIDGGMRLVRSLSQEGWDINYDRTGKGYTLVSDKKKKVTKKRVAIGGKLRYAVLHRDNSTCQRCGRTPDDGIKLEVDHKIPVDWGGLTEIDNLWTLCHICNGGKKHFLSDYDATIMKEIIALDSGGKRLKRFFELVPNEVVEPIKLDVVSGIRDWERTLRSIRSKNKMKIKWIPKSKEYPHGGYVYTP